MPRFEFLDISGDAGVKATGKSLSELFVNAASGMYDLMTDVSRLSLNKKLQVSAESPSLEGLLISWLNELLYHFDAHGFVAGAIKVGEFSGEEELSGVPGCPCRISALLAGEEFDPDRHERRLLIKAATYHKLKLSREGEGWECEVIFDI